MGYHLILFGSEIWLEFIAGDNLNITTLLYWFTI